MGDALTEVTDRLYLVPPERFVAERAAAVARAREAGDAQGAGVLAKLRRPTVAAWLVNLLALRRPDLVADLADLAAAMRAAHRDLHGEQLRELSAQRKAVVASLVATARSLATEAHPGPPASKLPLGEVETTLHAALADEEVAAVVRSGRLLRSVAYDGFGEVSRPQLRLITGGGPARTPVPDGAPDPQRERRRAAARQEVTDARTAATSAAAALERAARIQHDRERELAEIDAALADLAAKRAAVADHLAEATAAHRSARRSAVTARHRLDEAEAKAGSLDAGPPD